MHTKKVPFRFSIPKSVENCFDRPRLRVYAERSIKDVMKRQTGSRGDIKKGRPEGIADTGNATSGNRRGNSFGGWDEDGVLDPADFLDPEDLGLRRKFHTQRP